MGDVPWMVAVMAALTVVTSLICAIMEKKCICIDQNKKKESEPTAE